MELKDFVAETIVQICEGIQEAQKRTAGTDAVIAAPVQGNGLWTAKGERQYAQTVHFEVLLEEKKTRGAGGKVTVGISVLKGGLNAEGEKNSHTAQRVSFDIPVVWPSGKTSVK